MVTTLTLNPCIDWTVSLSQVVLGQLNLVDKTRSDVSGKGVNVSVVLNELGVKTMCMGISFDSNGKVLTDKLDILGIPHDFVVSPGNIRTNIKVVDLEKQEMTELNSRGDAVSPDVISKVLRKLSERTSHGDIVTMSGRIPNGAGDDIYRLCAEAASKAGAIVVLDAEKAPLRLALPAKPFLIKPNIYELEETFGIKITGKSDILRVCAQIISQSVRIVCVSMGGDGAMIADEHSAYYSPALELTPKGFQGAGDSLAAGICKAMEESRGMEDMLRFGMAAAAASIIREGTLLCRRDDYEKFLQKVRIERIPV